MSFEDEAYDGRSTNNTDEYDESEEPTSSDEEFVVDDDFVEYMSDDEAENQKLSSNNKKRHRVIHSDNEDEDMAAHQELLVSKKRGRPSGIKNKSTPTAAKSCKKLLSVAGQDEIGKEKPPNHSYIPYKWFSLTIVRRGGDISLSNFRATEWWIKTFCIRGAAGLETGSRANNLYIQSVFETRYPKDKAAVSKLQKMIKDNLPNKDGIKIQVKPFEGTQDFITMVGYCTKDQGICYTE